MIDNKDRAIRDGVAKLPEMLQQAGYEIAFLGKSHIKGALRDTRWDYYLGYKGQADYYHCSMAEGINGVMGPDTRYTGYVDDLVTSPSASSFGFTLHIARSTAHATMLTCITASRFPSPPPLTTI